MGVLTFSIHVKGLLFESMKRGARFKHMACCLVSATLLRVDAVNVQDNFAGSSRGRYRASST